MIGWYREQIYIKLMRALDQDDFDTDIFKKDSDGSAKVALIAIDRCISSWGKLREHFPEESDNILDILLHLDNLRKKTEQFFPNARNFVRPGFDDLKL